MSEQCTRTLEAIKTLLTNPQSYSPYCFGTSEMVWKKIKTEGLTPVVCSAGGQCTDSTYADVDGRRLTRTWIGRANNKMCSVYARRAVKKSAGSPLNITFNTQLDVSNMRPSKEFIESGFDANTADISDVSSAASLMREAKSICSPEAIKEMFSSLPEWSKSFISQKSANFVSLININPISIENVYQTEPLKELWND